MARKPKLKLVSKSRHRASAAERRQYGGKTVTVFLAIPDESDVSSWFDVTGYGPTPGERKTDARKKAEAMLAERENPCGCPEGTIPKACAEANPLAPVPQYVFQKASPGMSHYRFGVASETSWGTYHVHGSTTKTSKGWIWNVGGTKGVAKTYKAAQRAIVTAYEKGARVRKPQMMSGYGAAMVAYKGGRAASNPGTGKKKRASARTKAPPKVAPGDVLELDLIRVPIYASSGVGSQRETKKRVTVSSVLDDGSAVVRGPRKLEFLRLDFDEQGHPHSMRGDKARYDVMGSRVIKRAKKNPRPKTSAAAQRVRERLAAVFGQHKGAYTEEVGRLMAELHRLEGGADNPATVVKYIGTIGDVDPIQHDGGIIYDAGYGPHMTYFQTYDDDQVTVFDFPIADDAAEDLSWADWPKIADYIGAEPDELLEDARSKNVFARALVYQDVGSYAGFVNIDQYPKEMTIKAAERDYGKAVDAAHLAQGKRKNPGRGSARLKALVTFGKKPKESWVDYQARIEKSAATERKAGNHPVANALYARAAMIEEIRGRAG